MTVTKVERRDDLPEETSGLFGCKAALFDQIVEKFAAGNVFQHQISNKQKDETEKQNKHMFLVSCLEVASLFNIDVLTSIQSTKRPDEHDG